MKKFWYWAESACRVESDCRAVPASQAESASRAEPVSRARNEASEGRTLYLNGPIGEETWFGDVQTPTAFRKELFAGTGPVTVWLNSPGGDVFAAAQIYNLLMEYPTNVTIKIDGIAASAASVIAMAGGDVLMSPVSTIMIHNPATLAWGDSEEMLKAKALLDEVKESIINAYELKTGLSRTKLSNLMDNETWMNARKAVELGFADKIMYAENGEQDNPPVAESEPRFAWNSGGVLFSRAAVTNSLLGKLPNPPKKTTAPEPPVPALPLGIPIESLDKRLSLIAH